VPEFGEIFSQEYQAGQQTQAAAPKAPEPVADKAEQQIQQEVVKYGTGKPKRVVIKAKIIND
jgi:hypothetical protein